MSAGSDTALLDALNRLGGRQAVPGANRDLVAAAPRDMPLVAVRTVADAAPSVVAHDVVAFMARALELEPEAFGALERLVAGGVLRLDEDPGADPATWVTQDRRGVARQAVQWALDHPEHGLGGAAFRLAQLVI